MTNKHPPGLCLDSGELITAEELRRLSLESRNKPEPRNWWPLGIVAGYAVLLGVILVARGCA